MKINRLLLLGLLLMTLCVACAKEKKVAITEGSKVSFDYTLMIDGKVVDSSKDRQPLEYTQGSGQIIPGLEKELSGLTVGDEKTVAVPPEEGYGQIDSSKFSEVPKTSLPPELEPQVGMVLAMQGPSGKPLPVKISDVKEDLVVLDLNHPLAGKQLNFEVKIISVE
ncbi:MAG: peptidylprolyl isomerase [Candidatus Omnitrophica bacterium]|nr:peptidylprolyl isomerase [Candidatus Omnitrophota bacterium]